MTRLHPLSAVTRVLSNGFNGLSIPVFVILVGGTAVEQVSRNPFGDLGIELVFVLAPLGLVVGAGYGYLSYRRFEYQLTDDTFDVGSGVLSRTEREIPIRRIQNVDVQQNVLHQLFDVAVVRIESAGGGATEATLSVVSIDEARRLQQGIRDRRAALRQTEAASDSSTAAVDEPGDAPAELRALDDGSRPAGDGRPGGIAEDAEGAAGRTATAPPAGSEQDRPPVASDRTAPIGEGQVVDADRLVTLRTTDLLVLAVTNFQFGSLVFLFFGVPFLGDLAVDVLVAAAEPFGGPSTLDPDRMTPDQYFVLGGVAGPLLAIAGYALSAIVAVQEYYGFELARRGDDLVYERGLFRRYTGSIPTDKIQTLTVTETAPMRVLGYAGLGVETAGYGGSGKGESQSAVPLAKRERVRELGRELFDYEDYGVERPPERARLRYAVRYGLVVLAGVAVAYGASVAVPGFTLWWVPAFAFLGVPVAAHLKWANRGYVLGDDHVVVRSGFWRRRTHVVPYYRLQTVVSEATVFQRRRDLASLIADTASSATFVRSAPTAYDLDADTVDELQRELRDRLQVHIREQGGES